MLRPPSLPRLRRSLELSLRLIAALLLCAAPPTLLFSPAAIAQPLPRPEPVHPFGDKARVAEGVYADAAAQFQKWAGGAVSQGPRNSPFFQRTRVGTVMFAPGFRVHIDATRDTEHFPSFYTLVDARGGADLIEVPVFDTQEPRWYFPGNGLAYLNQKNLGICGTRMTRKLARQGGGILEVPLPLIHVGAESRVVAPTPLFDSPAGKIVVASVLPESSVTVLGMAWSSKVEPGLPLLVKTPLGLTGWHLPHKPDKGIIEITQCN